MKRASYIGAPEMFNLNMATRPIVDAYGLNLYLVGSSLVKRDYRDVDLRLILPDEKFDEMFPNIVTPHQRDARWSLYSAAISEWISNRSGLKIDFQVQKESEANQEYPEAENPRYIIGFFATKK